MTLGADRDSSIQAGASGPQTIHSGTRRGRLDLSGRQSIGAWSLKVTKVRSERFDGASILTGRLGTHLTLWGLPRYTLRDNTVLLDFSLWYFAIVVYITRDVWRTERELRVKEKGEAWTLLRPWLWLAARCTVRVRLGHKRGIIAAMPRFEGVAGSISLLARLWKQSLSVVGGLLQPTTTEVMLSLPVV